MCDFEKLAAPFGDNDLTWRVQRSGKKGDKIWAMIVPYVQNRAIMQRLDDIAGPAFWRNEYVRWDGGILCGISLRVDEEWVTKWDGAPETNIEAFKGGLSDAMKRAAVQWGMGRHLYSIKAQFAEIVGQYKGQYRGKLKDSNEWFDWDPPSMDGGSKPKAEPTDPNPKPDNFDEAMTNLEACKDKVQLVAHKKMWLDVAAGWPNVWHLKWKSAGQDKKNKLKNGS